MAQHLLMLGGGHAHLSLLEAAPQLIGDGHHITLVSPEPVQYYSGMGPGMLGGTYAPEEIRFPIREMAETLGVRWVRDRATRIRAGDRVVELAGGEEIPYGVLSVNTGSSVAPTVAVDPETATRGPRVFTVKPVSRLLELRNYLEALDRADAEEDAAPCKVVVVGGGPAAVEAAGNVRRLLRSISPEGDVHTRVELMAGRGILSGFPGRAKRAATRSLQGMGVEVRLADPVRQITADGIVTRYGTEAADAVLLATGVVPSRLFTDSGLPVGSDGSLAVNDRLCCLGYENILAAGDCIWFTPAPLPRAGVFAVREAPVLVRNVREALSGRFDTFKKFSPGRRYLVLLNLGDGTGLFYRRIAGVDVVYRGRSAWRLKDRIDRAFMQRFGSEADRGNEH